MRHDDAVEAPPGPVDEPPDVLWVELLDERRVALRVREHHRDLAAPRPLRRRQLDEALAHGSERGLDDRVAQLRPPLLERLDRVLEPFELRGFHPAHAVSVAQ
jgi:hypothetical protein